MCSNKGRAPFFSCGSLCFWCLFLSAWEKMQSVPRCQFRPHTSSSAASNRVSRQASINPSLMSGIQGPGGCKYGSFDRKLVVSYQHWEGNLQMKGIIHRLLIVWRTGIKSMFNSDFDHCNQGLTLKSTHLHLAGNSAVVGSTESLSHFGGQHILYRSIYTVNDNKTRWTLLS